MVKNAIGFCLNKLDEALEFLKHAYEIKEMITANAKKDNSIAKVLHDLADCYIKLEEIEVAFEYLNRSLVIKQNITTNAKKNRNISATIHIIGYCYKKKDNYHKALEYFHQKHLKSIAMPQKTPRKIEESLQTFTRLETATTA